jgi:hypothetical protein
LTTSVNRSSSRDGKKIARLALALQQPEGQQLLAPFSLCYDGESQMTRIIRQGSYVEPVVIKIDGDGLCSRRNMSDFEIIRFLKQTLRKTISTKAYDIVLIVPAKRT